MKLKWKRRVAQGVAAAMLVTSAAFAEGLPAITAPDEMAPAGSAPQALTQETAAPEATGVAEQDIVVPILPGDQLDTDQEPGGQTDNPASVGPSPSMTPEAEALEETAEIPAAEVVRENAEEDQDIVRDFTDTADVTGISDEIFYGEYDKKNGAWIEPGYFDYEAHPEMAAVQAAVMDAEGDYTDVKAEILQYYKEKRDNYKLPVYGSTGVQQVFLAQALERNLYPHLSWKVLGFNTVTSQPQYVDYDVSYQWGDITGLVDKKVTFYAMATQKNGTMAEFDSRESEHPPVLEVESNGVVTTFTASADATVSAGSNESKNYGKESVLRAEESVTTIGASEPTDTNTKRALIQFDLGEWNMSDTVTRATLKLYGRNSTDDSEKEVLVMRVTDNDWTETGVTFKNYEHMAYSWDGEDCIRYMTPKYSGHRYREEQQRFESVYPLIGGMFVQGETNQEYYAYIALKLWAGWLYQSGKTPRVPPSDKSHLHPLDIGCRAIELPNAMAWFITSEHMTPDLYSATLKHLWLIAKDMTDTGYGMDGSNNIAAVGVRGLHTVNTYYDEFRIHSEAQARVWKMQQRVYDMDLIRPDGAYSEGSLVYASMAASNIITLVTPNEITGCEDLPFEDPKLMNQVEEVALYLAKMSAPGFKDPQWGDSGQFSTSFLGSIKSYTEKFDNPYLNYYADTGVNRLQFPFTSCKYDSERRIALRSGWGENDVYLYTDMDGGSVSHAHADDNAIIVAAYGKYLLADPLYASYSDSLSTFSSTGFHNTVEIDGATQKGGGKGDIRYWETNSVYDNTSNWSKAYRNNGTNEYHARNILYIRPGFFLVSDYLKPYNTDQKTHTYKQRWIMTPDAEMTVDTATMTARSNTPASPNIQVVQADKEDISLEKVNDRYVNTRSDRAVYTKSGSGPVLFDTVLYPQKAGGQEEVTSERIDLEGVKDNGATASNIQISDAATGKVSNIFYYLVHDAAQQAVRKFGDYETDARLAYVERNQNGTLTRLIIQDGTYIKDLNTDRVLFQSNQQIAHLGCNINQGAVELASTVVSDLQDMTLFADTNSSVTSLTFNGAKTQFKKSGRYLYFGDEPILEDDTEENPEPTRKPSNDHSGGGINRPGGGGLSGGSGGQQSVIPAATPAPTATAAPEGKPSDLYQEELAGFWGSAEVSALVDQGVFQGNGSTLDLYGSVTRAEFVALLSRALNWEMQPYQPGTFGDVQQSDWFAAAVQTAKELGVAQGGPDGAFRPNDPISREEMAKIMVLALGDQKVDGMTVTYQDSGLISGWALEYVEKATALGLLQGDENQNFNPTNNTTRGEAAVVIWRLMQRLSVT